MDRTELAWAAGFWDGEGSAWLTRAEGRVNWQPQARINQSSTNGMPEVLTRFRDVVALGELKGPELKDGKEPLYRWVISSRSEVERLGCLLWPWLGAIKLCQLRDAVGDPAVEPTPWSELSQDEQRGWCAGLWDGEGSVCLLKHRSHAGHFVPEASITQSSEIGLPEVLRRMSSIGPAGFFSGPYLQPTPHAPVYRWKLFRLSEIRALIDHIRPWLGRVKVDQAEHVFAVLTAQPALARGNPAWGSHKTHCVRGHDYSTARVRPFKSRGKNIEARRPSHHCLACVREDARAKRIARKQKNGG